MRDPLFHITDTDADTVPMIHRFGSIEYDLSVRTHVMGVLNVTPDSFSDGGKYAAPELAYVRAMEMVEQGADFIDIGGESTRPGSDPVPEQEELERVIPLIDRLAGRCGVPVSIDTYKSRVAEAALGAGATIVNDITGLHADPEMAAVIARHRAGVVLMHINGVPRTMQEHPRYENLIGEISSFLGEAVAIARSAGIESIIVDPGIGFGKTLQHNLTIMKRLREFESLGYPILVGPSRKSFLGAILGLPVDERLEGTLAAAAVAIQHGAAVLRVHDVREVKRVATVVDAILKA
jgi:dihydropteroate synthase